ncbi:MAG: DsbA family protein [Micavibrio sp.]
MKNLNKKTLLIIGVLVLVVLGAAVALTMKGDGTGPVLAVEQTTTETATSEAETAATTAPAESEEVTYETASLPSDPLGVRTLGDPNAPVKIEEFASLTCGHCAHFHRTTFPELKKKYIDTGKVFFTFTDFPLNAPALDATMVTRCMPPERYFTFLSFLFQTQDQWAFSQSYKDSLRQNAKLAGMTDEAFDACLANTALKDGVVARMQQNGQKHSISSTPSFVINGATVLTGALPIEGFDKAIADAEAASAAPAPAEETPATTETETEEATPADTTEPEAGQE